ncbi:hypothetical protein [Nitrosospira sp. NpAV]|uniref:hypothetical protein n=1 Tax=Nitrosospira sp. NpAV TaxID=58133 RepID=UPI001E2C69DE|nr:hypothetical protein [Nitrosospira sp. NpAV]
MLTANTLLRPVVNRINRQPNYTPGVEMTNTVYVIAKREYQKDALALLEQSLEEANYPTSDLVVHPFGANEVEIEAVLLAASVDGEELDRLIARLALEAYISQAFWSPSSSE